MADMLYKSLQKLLIVLLLCYTTFTLLAKIDIAYLTNGFDVIFVRFIKFYILRFGCDIICLRDWKDFYDDSEPLPFFDQLPIIIISRPAQPNNNSVNVCNSVFSNCKSTYGGAIQYGISNGKFYIEY